MCLVRLRRTRPISDGDGDGDDDGDGDGDGDGDVGDDDEDNCHGYANYLLKFIFMIFELGL